MGNYVGFVGSSYKLDNLQFDCQNSINLYPEVEEMVTNKQSLATDGNIAQLVATPGLLVALSLDGDYIRGLYQSSTGQVYAACGNIISQITEVNGVFTATTIGTLLTNSGPVNFCDNAGILVIVDGENGYGYQNSTFTQIVDPSWQGANFACVLADQFLFNVPGTNEFYWSDINALTFTALGGSGVDAKQGNSDPIVGMVVYGLFLWLIGSQTTEIWTTNPSATTSYQRIPGPFIQSGCLAGQTVCFTEYGGMWVTQNPRGGAMVVMTPPQGYNINRISTTAVEQALQSYGQDMINATAFVYQMKGHIFYQINPPNGKSSWVYDVTLSAAVGQAIWHERTYTNSLNIQSRHLADNAAVLNGFNLVGDYNNPNIYFFDYNTYTDNGAVITRTRTAPHIASGFNRIFHNAFTLECRTGVGSERLGPRPPGPPTLISAIGAL